jgi:hypothetical protein
VKKEIAEEWTRRLRSGSYLQGQGRLAPAGKFCCLGVLCEIAAEQGVVKRFRGVLEAPFEIETVQYGGGDDDEFYDSVLPEQVAEWAGIQDIDPYFRPSDEEQSHLSALNDEGSDFNEIAQYIDEYWSQL